MQRYSADELLERLEWRRQIRNVMGRVSHDYSVKQEDMVYDRYWSAREDVCLGLNNGYYNGKEVVSAYYAALGEEITLSSELVKVKFPDELGGKSDEETRGVGMITYLPFDSHVIEIAEDGKTAKGIWNVRGSYCKLTSGGPVSYWTYGWAAVDFVYEDGEWKVWHMLLLYNVDNQCGVGYAEPGKVFEAVPGFEAIDAFKMPEPNTPEIVMEHYHAKRKFTASPRCPEPYETFAKTFSYGV